MQIQTKTKLVDIVRFLQRTYNIYLRAVNSNFDLKDESIKVENFYKSKRNIKKAEIIFVINDVTVISDLINFFHKKLGLSVEVRDINGVKLLGEITIKHAIEFPESQTKKNTVENDVITVNEILKLGSNYDSDLLFRVLNNSAYKAHTIDEKWLVIKTLISSAEKMEYFSVKQGLVVVTQCFTESSQLEKIYDLMLHSNSHNVLRMASKLRSDLL